MTDTADVCTIEDNLEVASATGRDSCETFPSDFSIEGYEELRTVKVALQRHSKRGSTIASLLAQPVYDLVHAYQAYSLMQTHNEHWAKTRHAALEYLNITHCFLDSVTTRARSGRSSLTASPTHPIEAQLAACGCFGQEVALKGALGTSATRDEYHAKAVAKELSIWKDRMQREQKASKIQNKYIFNEFMYDHHESHVISLDRLRAAGVPVEVLTEANITLDDLRLAGYVIDDTTMLPLPPPNYIDTTPVEPLPEPLPEPEPEPSEPTLFELLVGMSYPQQIHTLKGVLEPLIKMRLMSGDLEISNEFRESSTDITFAILDERGALDALPLLKDKHALDGDIVHCVHDMEKKAYTAAAEQALLAKLVAEEEAAANALARREAETAAKEAESRVVELEKAAKLRDLEEAAARRTAELEKRAEVEALAAAAISMSSAIDTMTRLEKEKSAEAQLAAEAEVLTRLTKAQEEKKRMLLEAKAIEAEAARLSEAAAAREVEAKKAADATAKALVTAQKDQVDQNTTSMQRLASQREENMKRRVSRGPRASVNMTWTPAMGPPRSKQGFALKKGHLFTSMKRRYFTVEEGFITYYENFNKATGVMENQKGTLYLRGYSLGTPPNPNSQLYLVPAKKANRRSSAAATSSTRKDGGSSKDLLIEFQLEPGVADVKVESLLWKEAIAQHILFANTLSYEV